MRSTSRAAAAFVTGWKRILGAPLVIAGVWLATTVSVLPSALAVHSAIADHLGASLTASRVAAGMDNGWWQEFAAQARRESATLSTSVIGAAAPLSNWSAFLDSPGIPAALVATAGAALILWIFLTGGLIDRFARARRVGRRAFFGTCGLFFPRLLRLALMSGAVYWLLAVPFHRVLFDGVYPWLIRDVSAERVGFLWRVLCYAIWLAPLLLVNLVVDYAKVRAVIEDRRSMLGALVAGMRFVRRHPLPVAALYVTNALVLAVAFAAYLLVAPGARGGDWRLLAVLALGQAWILARIATRLAFLTTATVLVQQSLAHAEYTAVPLPVWPDSPGVEAVENAARYGTRPTG